MTSTGGAKWSATTPGPGAPLCSVHMDALPVGLVLGVDEYLTNLSQELGMIGLDRRPVAGGPGTAEALQVVDDVLSAWAGLRNEVRRLAEGAYDRGQPTFTLDLDMPLEAGGACVALAEALREVTLFSAEGRILLPPLPTEAAEFFFSFLAEVNRQLEGRAPSGEPGRRATGQAVQLGGRRAEHLSKGPATAGAEDGERRWASRTFARDSRSATEARRFVVGTLRSWGLEQVAQRAELPAGELLANALLHSSDDIAVDVEAGPDTVMVEVHDCSPLSPGVRRRGNEADSGRGLLIVDALVDRWGYDANSRLAKRVWFELSRTS